MEVYETRLSLQKNTRKCNIKMKIKVWPVIDSNMQSHFFTFFLRSLRWIESKRETRKKFIVVRLELIDWILWMNGEKKKIVCTRAGFLYRSVTHDMITQT